MIEITLKQPEDFLKVKETLTRMGIANNKDRVLYQSCHILQKQGRYYIVHFKEMLRMDGRQVDIDGEDYQRRDSIAQLLEDWGLIAIKEEEHNELFAVTNNFRVISFKQKDDWKLVAKYTIGN
ncbi:translation repressor [Escherichia phage vB_EcoM_RZ]|uniref:Translation repressor protein n=5 Tax=Gaprivervirus TaxID=1913654 RepID=A0A0A7HDJ1_9CAUD|nr:translation repressor [Escherichia phage vB_EcoM_VR7]YP_009207227.1 translation repressor [Escherichia phage vB_EcoM_VR20]YP_009209794.1 translation repressor [Escherichia phage vB_EcoM_VR25]YP_009213886.1 translation repressor [Escherichia phage vB_EcoM_VR26]YP_010650917.1 translation repressor [Escherichia phage vB_EcoM_RZ]QIN95539.1 translation repressor protein [Escherichia phage MN01]QMP18598.1 translational repressor protein [Escherichia phage CJ20]QMV33961.1 translation repressor p